MSNTTLNVSLTDLESDYLSEDQFSLVLEQDKPKADTVNMRDLYNMWLLAKSGKSARTYNPYVCDIGISETDITFSLGFYVWTVPFGLEYSLSTTLGEIDEGKADTRENEFNALFELSDTIELDKEFSGLSYQWLTPVFTELGHPQLPPPITIKRNSQLSIPRSLFGEARVNLVEKGYYHEVEVTIVTVDEDGNNLQITEPSITITALWEDHNGEKQTTDLDLEIPECVLAALRLCKGKPSLVCQSCEEMVYRVYVNACTDKIVKVDLINIGETGSWCLPV